MQNRARDRASTGRKYLTKRLRDKLIAGRTTRARRQGRRESSHSSKNKNHGFGYVRIVTDLHNRSERGSQKT